MEVIWQSEIDPYGCRVLKKHWPEVVNHGNIKEINWGDVVRPDIICGGYPCQPFSTAGKRNGTDDPRHLWPWVREAISELRPKYAILENVRGHVSLGLNVVLGEMASIGYDAEWQIVSAASVGAPHRRDRVIIVAYPSEQLKHGRGHINSQSALGQGQAVQESSDRSNSPIARKVFTEERWLNALMANTDSSDTPNGRQRQGLQSQNTSWGNDGSGSGSNIGQVSMGSTGQNTSNVADTDHTGDRTPNSGTDRDGTQEIKRRNIEPQLGASRRSTNVANAEINGSQSSGDMAAIKNSQPRQSVKGNYCRTQPRDGWWTVEPDVGRVANGVPSRVDRLRGLGNAVVPQVAELIGRMVIDYDTNL